MLKVSSCIHKYPSIWAKESPGKVALIHPESGRQLMYGQFVQEIDKKAQGLLAKGVKPGDRIASILPLGMETVILFYACAQIGAIYVPLGIHLDALSYRGILAKVRPAFLFYVKTYAGEKIDLSLENLAEPPSALTGYVQLSMQEEPTDELAVSWDHFWRHLQSWRLQLSHSFTPPAQRLDKQIHAWSPVLLLVEGSGDPGILLCHENIISQTLNLHSYTGLHRQTKTLASSHTGALFTYIHGICSSLTLGGTVVLTEENDPIHILQLMDRHCISFMLQQPEQYKAIWDILPPKVGQHPYLEYALFPIDATKPTFSSRGFNESMRLFAEKFGSGLSYREAGGFMSFCAGEWLEKSQEQDLALFEIREEQLPLSIRESMRVDGSSGATLDLEEEGQICIHPPNVFLGYFHSPTQTGEVLSKEGVLYSPLKGHIRDFGQKKFLIVPKPSSHAQEPSLQVASVY